MPACAYLAGSFGCSTTGSFFVHQNQAPSSCSATMRRGFLHNALQRVRTVLTHTERGARRPVSSVLLCSFSARPRLARASARALAAHKTFAHNHRHC